MPHKHVTQARSLFAFRRLVEVSLVVMASYPRDSARVWICNKSILSSKFLPFQMEDALDFLDVSPCSSHDLSPPLSCSDDELCDVTVSWDYLTASWDYQEGLSRRWAFSQQGQDYVLWSNPTLFIGEVGAVRVRTTAMSCVAM